MNVDVTNMNPDHMSYEVIFFYNFSNCWS